MVCETGCGHDKCTSARGGNPQLSPITWTEHPRFLRTISPPRSREWPLGLRCTDEDIPALLCGNATALPEVGFQLRAWTNLSCPCRTHSQPPTNRRYFYRRAVGPFRCSDVVAKAFLELLKRVAVYGVDTQLYFPHPRLIHHPELANAFSLGCQTCRLFDRVKADCV
jgi:hypothetical protein